MLQKSHNYQDSIKTLLKAKELNPDHPPISTELGISYRLSGDYEKAEEELIEALKERKFPNYKHRAITQTVLAKTYRRWAEAFASRGDYKGQLGKLEQSFHTIVEASKNDPNDREVWDAYIQTCLDYGIALARDQDIKSAKEFLEKCVKPIQVGKKIITVSPKAVSLAYFHLARIRMNETTVDPEQIESLIEKGLAVCPDFKLRERLTALKNELTKGGSNKALAEERKYGNIRYFVRQRKFGIIESCNATYLFLLSGFREAIPIGTQYQLNGRKVSFLIVKDEKKEGHFLAVDVVLL
jgi:tetratricopeptide (TPR) repeat protein